MNVLFQPRALFLYSDTLHGLYRDKPMSQKCINVARFVFSWQSLVEDELKPLPLQKAILRTYLEVIPRLVPQGGSVDLDVTVAARTLNNGSIGGESIPAGPQQQISVTRTSNKWVELNVTETLQGLWPPQGSSGVEFTVTLQVDCKDTKKVPASFVDPSGISLGKPKRRERYLPLQPMLLVYMEDEAIMKRIKQDKAPILPEEDVMEGMNRTEGHVDKRQVDSCRVERFDVNFYDLRLFHVLAPHGYNAGKCVGTCSHTDLKRKPNLGNNHAKIMASAHLIESLDSNTLFSNTPKEPCCVPIRYSAMTMLMRTPEGLVWLTYPSMTVEDCGCR